MMSVQLVMNGAKIAKVLETRKTQKIAATWDMQAGLYHHPQHQKWGETQWAIVTTCFTEWTYRFLLHSLKLLEVR
jgi:hypothetical protein